MPSLKLLNRCDAGEFVNALGGLYEGTDWAAERAAECRPFDSLDALRQALADEVLAASPAEQLALIRAHPELGHCDGQHGSQGEGSLSDASYREQSHAGLMDSVSIDASLQTLRTLNQAYRERFGFPFVIAVKGVAGLSSGALSCQDIIAALRQRIESDLDTEFAESLRQVNRIAELRFAERFLASNAPARG